MKYLLVRHKVEDYTRWKHAFDAHSDAQEEAGIKPLNVMRNIDEPGEVVVLFEVHDLARARAFVTSPELPQVQEKAGVLDRPDIFFLE